MLASLQMSSRSNCRSPKPSPWEHPAQRKTLYLNQVSFISHSGERCTFLRQKWRGMGLEQG
eukprot:4992217-Amphidinium_carterae.1